MITAQQARELIKKQELTIEIIQEKIEMMARHGYNYWATNSQTFLIKEETIDQLKNMGYKIEVNETTHHFSINW